MRLEPSKPLRDTRRSAPGGTGAVPSAPFGLVGLAAVAIWAAGSAALTTLVRRRAATTRRARRLGVGGFGTGLPAAG